MVEKSRSSGAGEVCCLFGDAGGAVGLFAHMESNLSERVALGLRVAPFPAVFHPVGVVSAHGTLAWGVEQ